MLEVLSPNVFPWRRLQLRYSTTLCALSKAPLEWGRVKTGGFKNVAVFVRRSSMGEPFVMSPERIHASEFSEEALLLI